MALKRLKKIVVAAAPVTKPGGIPVVRIEGDLIKQYNTADAQVKAGEGLMKDLRSEILELGRDAEIYSRSIADPAHPTLTVKLQDERGEMLRVQFTSKYSAVLDVQAAEEFFSSVKGPDGKQVDINEFMHETVVGKFDCAVFSGVDGKFQQAIYDKFRKAIERVAAELEVACPLETRKVVQPLPCLHEKRWATFKGIDSQVRLTELCPNTTSIVPIRSDKTA
jgi:hypothetical protein